MRYEPSHARTVHLDSILKGELAENEFRKDFTHSERVAIGDWRLAIGDWRLAIGEAIEIELQGRNHRPTSESPENFPELPKGDTRDIAAKAERAARLGLKWQTVKMRRMRSLTWGAALEPTLMRNTFMSGWSLQSR
ncbi:hypothetical protein [Pseudomonas sp.]|uniref:hypothetical protein n=1 Tax=Pseudomonas sp. TaxID=306 RepID=UPI003FD85FA8